MTVSDDDFANLYAYLERRFDEIEKRLDEKADTIELTRMFAYMEKRFDELSDRIDEKADKKDVEKILNRFDAMTKRLDDHDVEIAALTDTARRHESNLETLAKKLKVKLNAAKA